MIVSIIVAVSENGAIGKENDLLWRLPGDMKHFKETTSGHAVITGRKNYFSIPEKFRPLPDRINIILTRNEELQESGCLIAHSLEDALGLAEELSDEEEVFIIGGGEIYELGLPHADKIYITYVHHFFEGDTYFPELNENDWLEISSEKHKQDDKNPYDFTIKTLVKVD